MDWLRGLGMRDCPCQAGSPTRCAFDAASAAQKRRSVPHVCQSVAVARDHEPDAVIDHHQFDHIGASIDRDVDADRPGVSDYVAPPFGDNGHKVFGHSLVHVVERPCKVDPWVKDGVGTHGGDGAQDPLAESFRGPARLVQGIDGVPQFVDCCVQFVSDCCNPLQG